MQIFIHLNRSFEIFKILWISVVCRGKQFENHCPSPSHTTSFTEIPLTDVNFPRNGLNKCSTNLTYQVLRIHFLKPPSKINCFSIFVLVSYNLSCKLFFSIHKTTRKKHISVPILSILQIESTFHSILSILFSLQWLFFQEYK